MAPVEQLSGTTVQTHRIVFRCPDPERRLDGVRLWADLDLGVDPQMRRTDAGWELRVPMPRLDCLEYLFQVDNGAAGEGMVTDPTNPDTKDGAFGPHSFLALPGLPRAAVARTWSRSSGRLHAGRRSDAGRLAAGVGREQRPAADAGRPRRARRWTPTAG